MIKIVIAGAAGRMGKTIIECALMDPQIKVVGGLEARGNPACSKVDTHGVLITSDNSIYKKCDIIIDFTAPQAFIKNLQSALRYGTAMVIGTTGFNKTGHLQIKKASRKLPIVLSPNMSTGINLLSRLTGIAARMLKGYDMEIIEVHHNKKKDAPSGTAVALAGILSKVSGFKNTCYGRSGDVGLRAHDEIGIHAIRAGDIVGDHTVLFAGPGERIELTHRAHSRTTFAVGALRAAKWLKGKKAGLYSMEDVLGAD